MQELCFGRHMCVGLSGWNLSWWCKHLPSLWFSVLRRGMYRPCKFPSCVFRSFQLGFMSSLVLGKCFRRARTVYLVQTLFLEMTVWKCVRSELTLIVTEFATNATLSVMEVVLDPCVKFLFFQTQTFFFLFPVIFGFRGAFKFSSFSFIFVWNFWFTF